MTSFHARFTLAAAAAAALSSLVVAPAKADVLISSFTPGDLVVLRGGDATNSNNAATGNAYNGEVSAYLDEYDPSGTYIGTIPVGSGLTLPGYGSFSHEGVLNLSVDGHYLTFGGYNTPAGTTARPVNDTATDVIGLIGNTAASLNTSTTITPAEGTGQYIRGVESVNGTQFYVAGKYPATTGDPGNGLKYVSGVGPTASVTTLEGSVDFRNVTIANNTLYGGTGSSSVGTHGAYQIGSTGTLPTSPTPTNTLLTNYSGGQSASNLALLDIAIPGTDTAAGTQNGLDVLYTIGDQSTSGITKYYFDTASGTWKPAGGMSQVALNASNIENPTGLIASVDPANSSWVDLYVSGQNGIYEYTDKSGDPDTALPNDAFNVFASPQTSDDAFYGLAFAPSAVPEPASLGLLGVGALALIRRRRA